MIAPAMPNSPEYSAMKLAKVRHTEGWETVGLVEDESITLFEPGTSLQQLLEATDPSSQVRELETRARGRVPLDSVRLLAPIDRQEVWATGVTYRRSQVARMEESEGGASFYDKVYAAPRPELFFKATPHRVSGPGQPVRIRQDAKWSVPEPELALVLNSRMELVGFTIGNDMSSRDIEGENPLYLPQAHAPWGLGPRWQWRCRGRRKSKSRWSSSAPTARPSRVESLLTRWPEVSPT
jgi:2-dehydro-3-deoxy-D-arabinonate dehydratase